ncbi:hypothetical protein [Myxosarcina sp. GI1(2024)]
MNWLFLTTNLFAFTQIFSASALGWQQNKRDRLNYSVLYPSHLFNQQDASQNNFQYDKSLKFQFDSIATDIAHSLLSYDRPEDGSYVQIDR